MKQHASHTFGVFFVDCPPTYALSLEACPASCLVVRFLGVLAFSFCLPFSVIRLLSQSAHAEPERHRKNRWVRKSNEKIRQEVKY
jgi:hypothetical protein